MCMLFIKPKNLTLPEQYLDSLNDHNADGVSIYNLNDKELFKTLDYDAACDYLEKNHDNELIVHFRFGTSGKKSEDQLHGWDILGGKYKFFHNGVLSTFKGNKDFSDTQQLVNMFNATDGLTLEHVVKYLESFEKSSRFLIVENDTNKITIPNCAKWENPILINGVSVKFSNSYAIDWYLLQDEGHTKKPTFSRFNNSLWDDGYDYDFSNIDDDCDNLTDGEHDLLMELDYMIHNCNTKELRDFIATNPEIAAYYLKNEMV